ncbi:hypothetical protein CF327_g1951 [Tilletia walkeri]|nr:hypothetical protein CF327_g1951 [Tilletia walkeri]
MNILSARFVHLALLLLALGPDSPLQPGVQALPFSTGSDGHRRFFGSTDVHARSFKATRPRIGIVVKNPDAPPQFAGTAFNMESRGVEHGGAVKNVHSDYGFIRDVPRRTEEARHTASPFDSDPGSKTLTLPLEKVGGVRLKSGKNVHPMVELKRHLNAANQRLANIRKRSVDTFLLERNPSSDLDGTAILLDPTLTLQPDNNSPQRNGTFRPSASNIPGIWHGDNGRSLGHGPAVINQTKQKRLLGGLVGALGGDTAGSPSGFGSGPANGTNSTAEAGLDGLFGSWTQPSSNSKAKMGTSTNGSAIGYPVKNLDAATGAALTGAQPTTAEQSLGLDIEANDVGYIATIQIGSTQKPFRMLIDSGSADTWVASSSCTACGTKHQRLGAESTTFKPSTNKFAITYGTGSVSGFLGHDDVYIAGLKLANHTLGVAQQQTRDFTDPSVPFDGLMGLARSELSNAGTPTPIDALFASGQVSAPVMGYRLGRVADGRNDGEVTFGGVDKLRFSGNLIEVDNVSKQGFWEAAMGGVSFGGRDLGMSGRTAILDTGTTLIVAPKKDADAVHAAIPGSKSDGQGGYYIPCTTTQSLALTFGGVTFPIDPRDMLFLPVDQTNLQGDCISAISSGQVGQKDEWLKGAIVVVLDVIAESAFPSRKRLAYFRCDVSDPEQVRSTADRIEREIGTVSMLVNNAGVLNGKLLIDLEDQDIQRIVGVNLMSHLYTIRAFLPGMVKRNRGHVVTVSSVMGHIGIAQVGDYVATKHALVGLHESLRYELDKKYKAPQVRTTLVCPGHIKTALFAHLDVPPLARFLAPLLDPRDVAKAILRALERQESTDIYMPWYAQWAPLLRMLPSFLRDLAQTISGADEAIEVMYRRRSDVLKRSKAALS